MDHSPYPSSEHVCGVVDHGDHPIFPMPRLWVDSKLESITSDYEWDCQCGGNDPPPPLVAK